MRHDRVDRLPNDVTQGSLATVGTKLVKIGAKVVSHYVMFQLAEVAVSRQMFEDILMLIAQLRAGGTSVTGR